jgi:hypothetical protein
MAQVHARFDCKHELDVEVAVDDDVEIPTSVRGLGKCPACTGETKVIPVSGVAPQAGGQRLIVDSIMMMPY